MTTTAQAEAPRARRRRRVHGWASPGAWLVEAALTTAEVILVIGPTLALAAKSMRASGESFRVGTLLAAL